VELFSPHPLFSVEFITGIWFLSFVAASDTQPEPNNMTATEPTRNSIASLITNTEVLKMLKSLEDSKCFTIQKDLKAGTIRALHGKNQLRVFVALRKGESSAPWIVRMHSKLFV